MRLVEPVEISASSSTTVASRSGDLQNIINARVSLMILPQATLAGRVPLSGGSGATVGLVQYHSLIEKAAGSLLYDRFYEALRSAVEVAQHTTPAPTSANQQESQSSDDAASALGSMRLNSDNNEQPVVRRGLYGARQMLSLNTKGPYTHFLEI